MKLWLSFLVCISVVLCTMCRAAVQMPPALRIVRNRIVDPDGRDVVLRGVWFSDGVGGDNYDASTVRHIRQNWNANVIRIPIHPLEWQRRTGYLQKYVDQIVKAAGENGMYAIVGWHAHGNPLTGKTERPFYNPDLALAKEALMSIVTRYRECTWVLYDTFNEAGFITWDEWKPVAEELTDVVHSVNPKALTLVSGVNWSHDLSGVMWNPVKRDNIIYEVHAYPGNRNPDGSDWKTTLKKIAKRYPVMIGEWGYVESPTQSRRHNPHVLGTTKEYAIPLVEFARWLRIGWTVFIYSEYWEPQLIEYNDLEEGVEVLTRAGYFVREVLNGRPYPKSQAPWRRELAKSYARAKNYFREINEDKFDYGRATLKSHIRSEDYNQLYIKLWNPIYKDHRLPLAFFNFKIGYNLSTSNFVIEMREGEGISNVTKHHRQDRYGRALFISIDENNIASRFRVAAMSRQDQLILKGILGNLPKIINDVISGSQNLSREDQNFWLSRADMFRARASKFIKKIE